MKLFLGVFLVLMADIGASAESNVLKLAGTTVTKQHVKLNQVKVNHIKLMEALEHKTKSETNVNSENLAVR